LEIIREPFFFVKVLDNRKITCYYGDIKKISRTYLEKEEYKNGT